jgi:hypothetical protein
MLKEDGNFMDAVFDRILRCDNCEYDVDGNHIKTDMITIDKKTLR